MEFDYKKWAVRTEHLYMDILKEYDETVSGYFEEGIAEKQKTIQILQKKLQHAGGSIAAELGGELMNLEGDLLSEKQRLRRKMMLFIIGDGKSGKSTLINALLGLKKEIAEIDDLPNTRYIHVYTNEIEAGKVLIHYYNDQNELCEELITQEECMERIQKEREEIRANDRECKKKIRALAQGKSPEEKEEIERAVYQEFGKSGNIMELFFGIENSELLEQCNLIDTPGFNQNIDCKYIAKKKNIEALKSHYNQADGILWVLDSQTISGSNTKKMYSQLCEAYEDSKEDMKKNLFYVVNKMDIITKPEDKKRLMEEARELYRDLAANVVFLSAKMAFDGQCMEDGKKIAESGYQGLVDRVSQTFLQRQAGWNLSRIRSNYMNTKKSLEECVRQAYRKIEEYKGLHAEYKSKVERIGSYRRKSITQELRSAREHLMELGKERIHAQIDLLNAGSEEERKNQIIHRLFCLHECYDEFEQIYHVELHNMEKVYQELEPGVCLSEYEHYKNYDYSGIALPQMEELPDFVVSSLFSYEKEGIGEILSLFGGIGQRVMFWAKKPKILESLVSQFQLQLEQMEESIKQQLMTYQQERENRCQLILNNSYEKIVGKPECLNEVMETMRSSRAVFAETEKTDVYLYEMLLREDGKQE